MEIGNKASYMGVYSGEIVFPSNLKLPITLAKFCVITWIFSNLDDRPERITLRIFGPPERTEIIKVDLPVDQIAPPIFSFEGATKYVAALNFPMVGLIFAGAGVLEVVVETERELLSAGKLHIRIAESSSISSPTALPQPSEQSPSATPPTKQQRVRRRPSTG